MKKTVSGTIGYGYKGGVFDFDYTVTFKNKVASVEFAPSVGTKIKKSVIKEIADDVRREAVELALDQLRS
jgi:hypothetical protein